MASNSRISHGILNLIIPNLTIYTQSSSAFFTPT
jgi:hypothetical protein